jgi:hypothetical protein
LVLAGCYAPKLRDCEITCISGTCPSGLSCIAGYCRSDDGAGSCVAPDAAPDVAPTDPCYGVTRPDGCAIFVCDSKCELDCTAQVAWQDAETACEAWGGRLAEIDSATENDCTTQFLTSDGWIGLHQAPMQATPDAGWSWTNGAPLSFLNWAPGQPDDADTIENDQEDCGEAPGRGAMWHDRNCGSTYSYICEHD